jgi:DNA repair exonuclease SbcCD nuclease subunit
MNKIESLAKREAPDLIVILGDLLHTHEKIFTIALNKAYEFVRRMRDISPTYVLVGNHDYIQNSQFLTENHWMNAMKDWDNVVIVDTVIRLVKKGEKLVFVPYVPNGRFLEALETGEEWRDADCIFAHQEFAGCKMGAIISIDGDRWPEDYPRIVSGHIHSKQTPQPNIYYTGSAMQHAFGESDKNVIPIITFPYNVKEIDLDLPRKKIIYMDMDKIEDFVPKETNDQLKLTISGSFDEFKTFKKTEKYKELTKNGTKVVFKAKKEITNQKETTDTNFRDILFKLVSETKNKTLLEYYELVINNRKIIFDE